MRKVIRIPAYAALVYIHVSSTVLRKYNYRNPPNRKHSHVLCTWVHVELRCHTGMRSRVQHSEQGGQRLCTWGMQPTCESTMVALSCLMVG